MHLSGIKLRKHRATAFVEAFVDKVHPQQPRDPPQPRSPPCRTAQVSSFSGLVDMSSSAKEVEAAEAEVVIALITWQYCEQGAEVNPFHRTLDVYEECPAWGSRKAQLHCSLDD
jgi:hypothetical protein